MIKKKNLKKNFTYGFEIEGRFDEKLCRRIKREFGINCKDDGSVNVDMREDDDNWEGEEFALGVFQSFDKMIRILKWFKNDENYYENYTCGIHVHIKPKEKKINNLLRCMIGDYDFIQNLQNFAKKNLCKETKKRLKTSSYCYPYGSFTTTLREWRGKKKYAFIGNHPLGTFEFRFFSTCKHKIKNIKTFFNYFFAELAKVKAKKREELDVKIEKKENKIKEELKIEENDKTIKICV